MEVFSSESCSRVISEALDRRRCADSLPSLLFLKDTALVGVNDVPRRERERWNDFGLEGVSSRGGVVTTVEDLIVLF